MVDPLSLSTCCSLEIFNIFVLCFGGRADEIAKFIKFQNEEMEAFVAERDKLIKVHEEKMTAMRQRQWNEEVELEKEFDSELSHLMEKYTPR